MLTGDWTLFRFSYELDMPALASHLTALAAYHAASRIATLPPYWLQPPVEDVDFGAQTRHNTSQAWAWVQQRFTPGAEPLAASDLLVMHRLVAEQSGLAGGQAGVFRTSSVRVGQPSVGGYHFGAPAARLTSLLDRYGAFVDSPDLSRLPPMIHALLAHFFFDTIHPFLDGNGRCSRLIAAAILGRRGHSPQGNWALSRYFYRNATRYHIILHQAWRRCPFELTPFIAFGLEGFVAELRSIDSFIKMKLSRLGNPDLAAAPGRHRLGLRPAALSRSSYAG